MLFLKIAGWPQRDFCPTILSNSQPYARHMAATKTPRRNRTKDFQGIRLRGGSYQIRVYGGRDTETGKQVILTGSAQDEAGAIRLRDRFRADIASNRSPRTTGTLGSVLAMWLDQHPADPQTVDDYRFLAESFIIPALGDVRLTRLTQPGPSLIEKFCTDLRRCRRRCNRKPFIEHRKGCPSATDPDYRCDKRCKPHVCKPLRGSFYRPQVHPRNFIGITGETWSSERRRSISSMRMPGAATTTSVPYSSGDVSGGTAPT